MDCFPTDCLSVTRGKDMQYVLYVTIHWRSGQNLDQVIKINNTNKGQMDIMCLEI